MTIRIIRLAGRIIPEKKVCGVSGEFCSKRTSVPGDNNETKEPGTQRKSYETDGAAES